MASNLLVTGKWGEVHVTSAQQRNFNSGVVGDGQYVMNGLTATMSDSNTFHMDPGVACMNGADVEVPAGGVDVTVTNGTQGMLRNDLICMRYTMDGPTQKESVELVCVRGTPAATDPQDPEYNNGSILDGSLVVDMPLWRIPLDGITVGDPVRLFQTVAPLADAQPETGEDGGWAWVRRADGTSECWGRFATKQTNYENLGGGWTYSTSFDGAAAPWTRAYPAGLFCAPPTVNVNVSANRYSSASPSSQSDAAKVAVGVFAYGILSDMTLHVRAAGRWK